MTDKALLIAVINHGHATKCHQHRIAKKRALILLRKAGFGIGLPNKHGEPPIIVVSGKCGELPCIGSTARPQIITGEYPCEFRCWLIARDQVCHGIKKLKIQCRRHVRHARKARQDATVQFILRYLSKDVKMRDAFGLRSRQHCRHKRLPKFWIYVLGSVNPEAIHAKVINPFAVNINEPLHDARVLGEHIIEPYKIAI